MATSTSHVRRTRLYEALDHDRCSIKMDSASQIKGKYIVQQKQKFHTDNIQATMEMKLKIIENWEVTKFKAIERLAAEIEALHELEEKFEQRELEMEGRGLKIAEAPLRGLSAGESASGSSTASVPAQTNNTPVSTRETKFRTLVPGQHCTPVQRARKSLPARTMPPNIMAACFACGDSDMVSIGPNGTQVSKGALYAINWSLSGAAVTRKILMEVFDRNILAFHTLTGKPSPAFMDCDKPIKNKLNPDKVADIVHIVTMNLNMTAREVRGAITTKCADENKMFRQREAKRARFDGSPTQG